MFIYVYSCLAMFTSADLCLSVFHWLLVLVLLRLRKFTRIFDRRLAYM